MIRQILKDAVPVRIGRAGSRVQHLGTAMREDRERLTPQVRGAHRRARLQMPGLSGRPVGAEDPAAMQEMTINGADPRLGVCRDGRHGKHAHARQHACQLPSGQRALTRPDDRSQVSCRPGQGPAQQDIKGGKFGFCLIHTRDFATQLPSRAATSARPPFI